MNDKKKIAKVFALSLFIVLMCMVIFLSLVKNPNEGITKKPVTNMQEDNETEIEQQNPEETLIEQNEEDVSEEQLEEDVSYIEDMLQDLDQDTKDIDTGLNDEAIVIE